MSCIGILLGQGFVLQRRILSLSPKQPPSPALPPKHSLVDLCLPVPPQEAEHSDQGCQFVQVPQICVLQS